MVNVLTKPQVLKQPFAAQGDKNIIPNEPTGTQNASLQEGFPEITQQKIAEGGIPPVRKDFNGALNLMSQFYYFTQNGGTYTYEPEVANNLGGYPENAVLWYFGKDGTKGLVISNIGNNTNNFVTDPSFIGDINAPWSFISTSKSNLPLGTIVCYDAPSSDFGLEPLNDPGFPNGVLLTNVTNTYPDFYELCLNRKNLAINGNTKYSRYNHTQAEYTQELNSKGFCGWYVVDEVNNTIRLPYFGNAFMQGYTTGDINKQAGLPNIIGTGYWNFCNPITGTGAITTGTGASHLSHTNGNAHYNSSQLVFNASLSNPLYGKSSTVQPNAIGIYYYMVVATVATTIGKAEWDAKQDVANLVTSLSASSTDTQYPSAKCVYDLVGDVESLLSNINSGS